MKIKVAIIGFGRMGQMYCKEMQYSGEWDILYICDTNPDAREKARNIVPASTRIVSDEDILFNDPQVEVVGLFTLANSRKEQIEKAVRTHKHIIAEKPIADTQEKEQAMKQFIQEGEIGELAILRICHMTPGLTPGEGHEHEGPAFHDCGMHYVDIARWYAESDYKTWNAQGIRMWDYKDPWWIQCHGTFHNGVVFDITQGFVYGQLSKDQTHNAYTDIIGTKGIVRMTHDFKTATVELHGVNRTLCLQQPFGGKNLDKLCKQMAASIRSGIRDNSLPSLRDSIEASHYAWSFLEDARHNCLPSIGNLQTLEEIRERRKHMKNGYGLLRPAQ